MPQYPRAGEGGSKEYEVEETTESVVVLVDGALVIAKIVVPVALANPASTFDADVTSHADVAAMLDDAITASEVT